jgi:hypothetical protein
VIADPLGRVTRRRAVGDGLFPALREKRVAGKAGWAGFGYDSRKGVGACDRGPSGLFRKFVAPFLHCI